MEFVLIGGFAAVAHGVTLLTQDIDICCRFAAENLLRLQAALRAKEAMGRERDRQAVLQLRAIREGMPLSS
ncbi:MAG: hypothetical protein ACREKQ_06425 [Candidatus Rokuibacteriota bacterium]